ncbi:hypothetical protein GCM10022229_12280 [Luteimonas lutimaris]|uniref:diguanylate cyclase n=2 Tax=Luteimonas lutimaris TaxID=698645 RepID=A0ABP7MCD0_9GAMM
MGGGAMPGARRRRVVVCMLYVVAAVLLSGAAMAQAASGSGPGRPLHGADAIHAADVASSQRLLDLDWLPGALQERVDRQQAQSRRLLVLLLVVLAGSLGYWALKARRLQVSLRRMAETDALTGLGNRQHFLRQSAQALLQAERTGGDVALVVFDLDRFESINDRFGQDTGDWVLRQVAGQCRTLCRRGDHVGRIGGEEFAILLPGRDLRAARSVAEACRVRIAGLDSRPTGQRFIVTAGFGVTASSRSGHDLARMLSHADKALGAAKREGRNRVSVFEGDAGSRARLQVVGEGRPGQDAGSADRKPASGRSSRA